MDRLNPPLPLSAPVALVRILFLVAGLLVAGCLLASSASASLEEWMQISCVNPNGTPSTSEGWSESIVGTAIASTGCGPGSPMQAYLPALAGAAPGTSATLSYSAPGNASVMGGTVDTALGADGFGTDSTGKVSAVTEARLASPTETDTLIYCVAWLHPCSTGSSSLDYSGTVTLPSGRSGNIIAQAECASTSTTPCNQNARHGAWATADVAWADILLQSKQSPDGSGFAGSALEPGVRGTGHVVFTASVPSGPGIYWVSVAIDGRTVYAATPNTNGGSCVAVGTDPASGAWEFDHAQPCLTSEVVDVPVPTAGLPDGPHELAISLTDAAQNSATVLDQTITTSNPQLTPRAHGPRAIHAQFLVHWHFDGARTRLLSIRVLHLPRGAGVSARCTGPRCPRIPIHHVDAPRIHQLLRELTNRTFHAGDRLRLDVTERHHRPLHVELHFRNGARPTARLLRR